MTGEDKTCPRCKGHRIVKGKGIRAMVCPKCRGTGKVRS